MRETMEETGLRICDVRFLTAIDSILIDKEATYEHLDQAGAQVQNDSNRKRHYVTIFMGAMRAPEHSSQQPRVLEPEKCGSWGWTGWIDVERWAEIHWWQHGRTGALPSREAKENQDVELEQTPKLFLPILNLFRRATPTRKFNPWTEYCRER